MKITYHQEIKTNESMKPEQIVEAILKHRQIRKLDEFLDPPSPLTINLEDFGLKNEVAKTIKLLEKIKTENGMIVVYTDYDADGITGGTILWETLNLLGFKVMPYVPHRKLEGYGFSLKGIDAVKKEFNPSLIISVDHGITAKAKVTYAKSLGIPVIITDHHLKPEQSPDDAIAIFHIPELSGSGVSYFFSKMIYEHFKSSSTKKALLAAHFSSDYLALASIGTVADLVSLTGRSRSIVKYGLAAFSKIKRVGLRHIMKEAGIDSKPITTYEIGFMIAPRINAVGRLEHAIDALRLLCTNDEKKAHELASQVGLTNKERQQLVEKSVEEAKLIVENPKKPLADKRIIVLVSDEWHEGIIGLIASKIADIYYRPTIVITRSDGYFKGSARSIPSFHITDFLRSLKKHLIDVGGHKGAAGFTIEKNQLDDFETAVTKLSSELITDKDLERTVTADMKIPVSFINMRLARLLEKLQPFGIGNPQPSFYSQTEIVDARIFGKTNKHLKIIVKDNGSFPLELISFNSAPLFEKLSTGQKINIVYCIDVDRWGYEEKVRGRIINIQLS